MNVIAALSTHRYRFLHRPRKNSDTWLITLVLLGGLMLSVTACSDNITGLDEADGCELGTCEDPGDEERDDEDSGPPAFKGFTLHPQEGAYWEYKVKTVKTWGGTGGSGTATSTKRFRVTLGAPITLDGRTAFPMLVAGRASINQRWKYLAFEEHRILASENGQIFVTLFDGHRGAWAGSGFFGGMNENVLATASEGTIDNDFIHGPAVTVGQSSSSGQCEIIAGIRICGSDTSESSRYREFWQPGIGPVGAYKMGSVSSQTGGSKRESYIGLVDHSMTPVAGLDQLETEPNDGPGQAQPLEPGPPLYGEVHHMAAGYVPSESTFIQALAQEIEVPIEEFEMQDWYRLSIEEPVTLDIELELESTRLAHLSHLFLFVFDSQIEFVPDGFTALSEDAAPDANHTSVTLEAGTYYVALWGPKTLGVGTQYRLLVR